MSPHGRRAGVALAGTGAAAVLGSLAATTSPLVVLGLTALPLGVLIVMAAPWVLVSVVMFEMALGGHGHVAHVGPLSLRQVLVAGLLTSWAVRRVVTGDRWWPVNGASLSVSLAVGVMASALLISLALGHPEALQEGLTPAFLLLFFVFSDICRTRAGCRWLLTSFAWSIMALVVLQIGLNTVIFLQLVEPHALSRHLADLAYFTVHSPRFSRVFLVGSVLFPVGWILLGAHWLAGVPLFGRRLDLMALGLITIALVLTFTRGFWFVTIAGSLLLWGLTSWDGRLRWGLGALLSGAAVVVVLAIEPQLLGFIGDRVFALFEGGGDQSVKYRLDLYPRLVEAIARRPLWGYGLGYPVEGLLYFENSYLYYAIKVGLVGALCVLASWFWLLASALRLAGFGITRHARAIGAGWAAATVAVLVVTSINPLINSPTGMYIMAVGLALTTGMLRSDVATSGQPSPCP